MVAFTCTQSAGRVITLALEKVPNVYLKEFR